MYDVDTLARKVHDLQLERQRLRDKGASHEILEANRVRLASMILAQNVALIHNHITS